MQFEIAERKKAKLRVEFSGPSGSGKTFSALKCALGMTTPNKIFMIDTESGRGELYSHLGKYNYCRLEQPFTPERYIELIKMAENNGAEVIIIDSVSAEWEGQGGILEEHSKLSGNSYTNWRFFTPRHNKFLQTIINSASHVFTTVRRKQDYVLELNEKGKQVPKKIGMKEIQRNDFEYDMTLSFDIDKDHYAIISKTIDGLNIFDETPFKINEDTGKALLEWANSGKKVKEVKVKKADVSNPSVTPSKPKLNFPPLVTLKKMLAEKGCVNDKESLKFINNCCNTKFVSLNFTEVQAENIIKSLP